MAGFETAGSNLVIANLDGRAELFRQQMAALAAGKELQRPDGVKIGPIIGAEFGWPGAVDLVRLRLGETALVIIDHGVTGPGSGRVAQELNEVISASGADAVMVLPDTQQDAEGHIKTMRKVNRDMHVIAGPSRGTAFSATNDGNGTVDNTWKLAYKNPIRWGVRNFYIPGRDKERIASWYRNFNDAIKGEFRLWYDNVHFAEGGMDKILQAAAGNVNVFVSPSPYGSYPLSLSIEDVRAEIAQFALAQKDRH